MTARWSHWGATSGLLVCLLWAPIGLLVPQLPDLGSSAAIERFYRSHEDLLKVALLSLSCGFFFLLCFFGALVERLRRAEGAGPLTSIAFGSGLMFMTSLNIAVGLVATAGLLSGTSAPAITSALHAAAFVLAAPAAPAGAAFFVAIATLAFATAVFPRWLAVASGIAALANLGALGGIFSRTGPLNSGNGLVAGIAAPILAWVLWILLTSLWWLRQARRPRPAGGAVLSRKRGS
jgi:hypothetical protein